MAANVNADAFIPQLWEASVYRTLEDNLVGKKISRLRSKSDISSFGDTVYFNGLADPTISDYTGSLTHEALVSSQIPLLINQQKHYAFQVTDIEDVMANVDLKGSQAQRAAYGLARSIDEYLWGSANGLLHVNAGNEAADDDSVDSETILSDISGMLRILEENNVQDGNKWIVVPPWVKEKLLLAGVKFQINNGINGTGGMSWANYLDADIYVTNTLYNSNTAASPVHTIFAGSYDSIALAEKLLKTRAMEDQDSFSYNMDGLLVFGAEVIKPKEVVKKKMTYAAETAV